MKKFRILIVLLILVSPFSRGEAVPESDSLKQTHHQLEIYLDPGASTLRGKDVVTLYPGASWKDSQQLILNGVYRIRKANLPNASGFTLNIITSRKADGASFRQIEISKPSKTSWPKSMTVEVEYAGRLPAQEQNSQEKGETQQEGIFFYGEDLYYPQLSTEGLPDLLTFNMTVHAPSNWKVVSQGRRLSETESEGSRTVEWESTDPMEEIFLLADRYVEYKDESANIPIYAFLRNDEPELADRYIQAAKRYIKFFERWLTPFPHPKFALVENSRQTGYGMPSFTLLGSRIIRFPFILNTSYPHEILHNWWGNGVYIDPKRGNWAEGLTAYLADHLLLELEGKGGRYRFQELLKYKNYINPSNDFPIRDFRARTSPASQAVGYGKVLMVLHMLRVKLGDELFLKALRHFFAKHKYRYADFDRIKESFEAASGKNLTDFFDQWIDRTGAPEIKLESADYEKAEEGYELSLNIKQTQSDPAFRLGLSIAVWSGDSPKPQIRLLRLDQKDQTLSLETKEEPRAVILDPYTDVFRKLDIQEVPPSMSQVYGAENPVPVLPSHETNAAILEGYNRFAQTLVGESSPTALTADDGLKEIPKGALWLFGRNNALAQGMVEALSQKGIQFAETGVTLEGKEFSWEDHSFIFILQNPKDREKPMTWIVASPAESVPGLMRKLPHYGKYGYLVFQGSRPDNQLKGIWPQKYSGLAKIFQPGNYVPPPRPPLVPFKPE